MTKTKKRGRGRPPKVIDTKGIRLIEKEAGLGSSERAIATLLGMGATTFAEHKQRDTRISDALEKGRAKANSRVANALFQQAVTEKNVAAQIWWEKTRAGRSDRLELVNQKVNQYAEQIAQIVSRHVTDPDILHAIEADAQALPPLTG